MKKILAIAASNKQASINSKLLHFAVTKLQYSEADVLSLAAIDLPVYNEDIESREGIPEEVRAIYQLFTAADGFILACPEHNGLPPACFKNLLDWLSRIKKQVFQHKPVLLLSTSPGIRGGAGSLQLIQQLLPAWGGVPAGIFSLGNFYSNFNCGTVTINDADTDAALGNEVARLEKSLL